MQPITQIQVGLRVTGGPDNIERLSHRRNQIIAVFVAVSPRRRRGRPYRVTLAVHQLPPEAIDGARVFDGDFPDAKP